MFWIAALSVALALTLAAPWAVAGLEAVLQQRVLRRTTVVLARAGITVDERDRKIAAPLALGVRGGALVDDAGNPQEPGRDREEA